MGRRRYDLVYDREVRNHLAAIERKYHSLIRRAIERMLTYEPEREARNRKPLVRPSTLSTAWELRFGSANRFRVFYRADEERHEVHILAIGRKEGNHLYIGGTEFRL